SSHMLIRPPSTITSSTLSLHDALPIYCRGEIRRAAVLSSARYSWPHRQNLGVSVCYFLRHRLLWYWEYDPGQCDCLECGKQLDHSPVGTGLILTVMVLLVLVGGIKSIGRVTAGMVPFMVVFYVVGAIYILLVNLDALPGALASIFTEAFTGTSATGGFVGSAIIIVIQYGVARGMFSNESGLGSAAIAAAAAQTSHPVRQGLVSM